ncbi:MAG: hypothetical protein WC587_01380 [Candidatus Paceibacterota bacterium]
MKVTIGKMGVVIVQGVSDEHTLLFFAKISEDIGYCVVFGSPEKCLPTEGANFSELYDAKVAIGMLNAEMKVIDVTHGHKYASGGGFVETKQDGQIFFRLHREDLPCTYEGMPIKEVYLAI